MACITCYHGYMPVSSVLLTEEGVEGMLIKFAVDKNPVG